ncbi:unnamed protein product [Cylicocyclus nassatus]|uniref:Uncharacterized protein n=1 Tax=Cylicocyclus nassatus TaxID=53992 RepID=A0AA36HAY3_CYLNA|nr:unnamed protein product [Cylicocyclus nassatus]
MSPRSETTIANHYKPSPSELTSELASEVKARCRAQSLPGQSSTESSSFDTEIGHAAPISVVDDSKVKVSVEDPHIYYDRISERNIGACSSNAVTDISQHIHTTGEQTDLESSGDNAHIEGAHSGKRESIREIPATPRNLAVKSAKQTSKKRCAVYANCLETLLDYENSCERRYSREYLAHATPSFSTCHLAEKTKLKQLLMTQRSLRKRCLEQSVQLRKNMRQKDKRCPNAIPSTEPLDSFFNRIYYRSESVRVECHKLLDSIRRTCTELEHCCADAKSCELQLRTTMLQERLDQAKGRLIARYHCCEQEIENSDLV